MFFDDLNGLVFSVGNLKSYVGYLSSNSPCFLSDSYYAIDNYQKNFFENLKLGLSSSTEIKSLLEDDKIQNVEEYVNFLEKMSFKIGAEFQQQPLMIVNKLNENLEQERIKMTKILFESKNTPCLYYVEEAVSQLFSSGAFTGVTVNSGANSTWIKPIFEGYLVKKKSKKLPLGGEFFTLKLKNIIEKKLEQEIVPYYNLKQIKQDETNPNPNRFINQQKDVQQSVKDFFTLRLVRDIKEPLLQNYQEVFKQKENDKDQLTRNARLPDDTLVEIQYDEIKQMENYIFENKQNFKDSIELPQQIINCIMDCDSDMKRELLNKIYLSGGNSLIRNFKDNVENNLSTLQTLNAKIKVHGSSKIINRKMGSWLGASILGSTSSFQNMWVSKFEYEEAGENIILRKCLNQQKNFDLNFQRQIFVIMKIMKFFLFLLSIQIFRNESVRVPSPINYCFYQVNKVFDKSFMEGEMMNLDHIKIIADNEVNLSDVDKNSAYMYEIQHEEDVEENKLKLRVSNTDPKLIEVSKVMYNSGDITTELAIQDESYSDIGQVTSKIQTAEGELAQLKAELDTKREELEKINDDIKDKKQLILNNEQQIQIKKKQLESIRSDAVNNLVDRDEEISGLSSYIFRLDQGISQVEEQIKQLEEQQTTAKEAYDEKEKETSEKDTELHNYKKIYKFLKFEQDDLQYCIIEEETEKTCNTQYRDLIMTELSEKTSQLKVNTAQDAMRSVLSRLQLTTGKLFTWNNIKFNFNKDFQSEQQDRQRVKLDKGFVPLSYALKSLTNSVSTNKGDILNNLMITSIILKKILVLVETASGIRNFQCPPGEGDEINENVNEKQNQMDNLFVENTINFDFISKHQLQYELFVRDSINKEKITTIQQDLQKGNQNELYNPSFEIKNIMAHENTAIPKSDIHDMNRPLEKFSTHAPNEDNTLACSSGMMRDFPILVPFLSEEMLGFQLKEEGGSQNFELLYFYNKYAVRNERGKLKLRIKQYFEEDIEDDNIVNDTLQFYQDNGMLENVPGFFQKILMAIQKALSNIKNVLSSMFGFDNKKKTVEDALEENENITKSIEDVAIKANINFLYKDFQYDGETINDNFNFILETDAKGVIDLMVNQREIIDQVIDNYLTAREKQIKMNYEIYNENKEDDQPDIKFELQLEYDIYKIEALIRVNQLRLMTYLFRRLKFSPLVLPEGFELLQQQSYQNLYQQQDEIMANQEDEQKDTEEITKIDLNILNDQLGKKNIPNTFKNTIEMTENLSQDKTNRFKSKKHLVYSSFVKFMQDFFKKNFDDNADLAACLVPHENMQRGNKCPLFLKDFIRSISENPHNKIEFNSIYNLFFDYFETNPETLEVSVNEFIDQMFNFARFFRTKEFFQMGQMDTIKIIKDKVIEFIHQEDIMDKIDVEKIKDPNVEKQFRSLVYSSTLEDVGLIYPEFKYTSLQFLFTMLDTVIEVDEKNKDIEFKQKIKEQKAQSEREFQKLKKQLEDMRSLLKKSKRLII